MTHHAQWAAVHILFVACFLVRGWAWGHSRCRSAAFMVLASLAMLTSQIRVFTNEARGGALDAEIVPQSALDRLRARASPCEQWATWAADGLLVLWFAWCGSRAPTQTCRRSAVRAPGHKLPRCLLVAIACTSAVAVARIACEGSTERCRRVGA